MMKNSTLYIAFVLLLLHIGVLNAFCAAANFDKITITGSVLDERNQPVAGSAVLMSSGTGKASTVTDLNGLFKLELIPQYKRVTLKVIIMGYKEATYYFDITDLNNSAGDVKVKLVEDIKKNKKKNSVITSQNFSPNPNRALEEAFGVKVVSAQKTPEQIYQEANNYYYGKNGVSQDYKKAFDLYLQAAEKGHAGAQNMCGHMYYTGKGTTQDYVKAASWQQKSAIQGNMYAQYNIGLSYEKGNGVKQDYTDAFYWYKKSAEQGDVDAQFRVGYCYDMGQGIAQDYKQAMQWYLKAADQGDALAMNNIGVLYAKGNGVTKSLPNALAWYNRAAEKGNEKAKKNASNLVAMGVKPASLDSSAPASVSSNVSTTSVSNTKMTVNTANYSNMTAQQLYDEATKYYNGSNGVSKDLKKAYELYLQAAKKDFAKAQYSVADMLYYGEEIEKDEIAAYQWYVKAANNGDAIAANRLGNMFYSGKSVPQDYKKAVEWYEKSAEGGYKWGQYNLADMYYNGNGCRQDYGKAFSWYEKAAIQNVPEAQNKLGVCYNNGRGVNKDDIKAVECFRKSADQGFKWGQYNLAYMYYSGEGCTQDYKLAVVWFEKASAQNVPDAMNYLGICYDHGRGVTEDDKKAFEWFKNSAELGYKWGQYNLANMYYDGKGCTQDYKQAIEWYEKAAGQNIPEAMNKLGLCYNNGYGVEKNNTVAFEWYRKSADAGFDSGQFNLGSMYYLGTGCEKDLSKAFYWFNKAASQNLSEAQEMVAWCYFDGEGVTKDVKKALEFIDKAAQTGDAGTMCSAGIMFSQDTSYKDYDKAVYWTKQAVVQNNAKAYNSMGWFYENGYGVEKDFGQAFAHYKKAADLGDSGGMRHVGECYENGWGVEKDIAEAIVWYKKAEKAGNDKAKGNLSSITARLSGTPASKSIIQETKTLVRNNHIDDLPPMGKRIALIIGNADYQNTNLSLPNPTNDAYAMAKKLSELGFEIFTMDDGQPTTNLSKARMKRVVDSFKQKATDYDVALVFYSGHALQVRRENYLIPVDAKETSDDIDTEDICFKFGNIMRKLDETNVKTKIYLLDACRTVPSSFFVATRGAGQTGLASMPESEGTVIGYATLPGKVALDGKGSQNSPYTTALLKVLDEPGLPIADVLQRVREEVSKHTNGKQMPTESITLIGRFYFNYNKK